jgi:NADH-quinone oxidoreductase subunit N
MYFDDPKESHRVRARMSFRIVLSANGLALLAFGILPQFLMQLCLVAILAL